MTNNFTHTINVSVGLDITSLLAPENIPGIMKYLNVKNDADLLQAIVQDQYSKLQTAINNAGFTIVDSAFQQVQQEPSPNVPTNEDNKNIDEELNDEMPEIDVNDAIEKEIKRVIAFVEEQKGEISEVKMSGNYVDKIANADDLRKATGLSEDVEINFDDLDERQIMLITYLDKDQNIKFSIFDENGLKNTEE